MRLGALPCSLGAVIVVALGACLVFDGRVATDFGDGGPKDAAADGQQADTGEDTHAPPGGGVWCGNAGACSPNCYACYSADTKTWTYSCKAKDGGCPTHGYSVFGCDDDCPSDEICCAHQAMNAPYKFVSSHCDTSCSGETELCQLDSGGCTHGTCVANSTTAPLPPIYFVCHDE
jgi:hypothetical protein